MDLPSVEAGVFLETIVGYEIEAKVEKKLGPKFEAKASTGRKEIKAWAYAAAELSWWPPSAGFEGGADYAILANTDPAFTSELKIIEDLFEPPDVSVSAFFYFKEQLKLGLEPFFVLEAPVQIGFQIGATVAFPHKPLLTSNALLLFDCDKCHYLQLGLDGILKSDDAKLTLLDGIPALKKEVVLPTFEFELDIEFAKACLIAQYGDTTIPCGDVCCDDSSQVCQDGVCAAPTPAPVTPAPVTPAPITQAPVTPAPFTLGTDYIHPITPAPVTLAPITPAPVTPAPFTLAPITPAPVDTPITLAPITPAPTGIVTTNIDFSNGFPCTGEGLFLNSYPANFGYPNFQQLLDGSGMCYARMTADEDGNTYYGVTMLHSFAFLATNAALSFSTSFSFRIYGDNKGSTDGLAFVVHQDVRSTSAVGDVGANLGIYDYLYLSPRSGVIIKPALVIEVDTHMNSLAGILDDGDDLEADSDHIHLVRVTAAGDMEEIAQTTPLSIRNVRGDKRLWIDYCSDGTLRVYLDRDGRAKPADATIVGTNVNLQGLFSGNDVTMGFGSGVAAGSDFHEILDWTVSQPAVC